MEPRLSSSTKWTPFPEELMLQIYGVLSERFSDEYDINHFDFVVQGRIYPEEILLRVGLNSKQQLKQPNFELSIDFNPLKEKALIKIQKSMDLIGQLWEDFLEEDMNDTDLPLTWTPTHPKKKENSSFFRYSTINTELEKQADILLENFEKKLLYEDVEELDSSTPTVMAENQKLH